MIVVGTNSYVTLQEADDYFAARAHGADWTAETDDEVRTAALVSAAEDIDRLSFLGEVTTLGTVSGSGQALEWPRFGVLDRRGLLIEQDTVPQTVKDAQCEQALFRLTQASNPDVSDYQSFTHGAMSVTFRDGAGSERYADRAMRLLRHLLHAGRVVRA